MTSSEGEREESHRAARIDELRRRLEGHGIPVDQWGKGSAKTVEHLIDEIDAGETVLEEEGGELIRRVGVVFVQVVYREGERAYRLLEDRQEFPDGRVRKREHFGASMGEKMKPGEDSTAAVHRALKEELEIDTQGVELENYGGRERLEESPSYPGLKTKYTDYIFRVTIPKDKYRPEGYVEARPESTTFFVWAPLGER